MIERLGPYLLGPNNTPENGIYTGDAKLLSQDIPSESVDLIFCDPIYDRIEDYRWLAETAMRVLKPDSACLVWYAHPHFDAAYRAMIPPLAYAWQLYWQRHGHIAPGRCGICVITPCLWLEKGRSKTYRKMADWFATTNAGPRARTHRWGKPDILILKWLRAFTRSDSIVFDPFCGSGVVSAMCKVLGLRYLAFEIDPAVAEDARQRVRETQPPLPLEMPIQENLL